MKTLYEGLLSDIDNDIDDNIVSDWIKNNCMGRFKIMRLKNGTYKVWGDLIVKGVANIPAIRISYLEGSLYIEDSDISNLDGLFADGAKVTKDINITGCKCLNNISGIPFAVNGSVNITNCPALRDLSGVDCFAGRVSIMRCGKRFTQATVKKVFNCAIAIFCSEEELEANIKESFQDPILIRMYDQMRDVKSKIKIKDIIGDLALDKISPSHRTTFEMPNEEKQMHQLVRSFQVRMGPRGFAVAETWDGEFTYLYDSHQNRYSLIKSGWSRGENLGTIAMVKSSLSPGSIWMNNVRYVHVWILDDNNLRVWGLQSDRRRAKEGMINTDKESLRQFLRNQLERYRAAANAIRAARKSDQYQATVKVVDDIMKRFSKFMSRIITDPSWAATIPGSVSIIFDDIRKGYERGATHQQYGVIYAFQNWSNTVVRVLAGEHKYDNGEIDIKLRLETLEDAIRRADTDLSKIGM